MKVEKKKLATDIAAAILSNLKGLNTSSAKKLIKAVDDSASDLAKYFIKLQEEEAAELEKEAKKAAKKIKDKAEKVAEAEKKAAKKAAKKEAFDAKVSLVTGTTPEAAEVVAPAPVAKKAAKKVVVETADAASSEETVA